MERAKMCKQCGEIRSLEAFRKYYSASDARYKYCLDCERVNSRHKYLRRKASRALTLSDAETQELQAIEDLYTSQRVRGLHPPNVGTTRNVGVIDLVNKMRVPPTIVPQELQAEFIGGTNTTEVPDELQHWLARPLDGLDPEYLQDTVYADLKQQYRPLKYVDKESLLPVYDDTYKQTLDEILKRFDEYEESLE